MASESTINALERLAGDEYCYLTTTGRVSGRPHEIEIWFGVAGGALYMMSGGGQRADWVKNLLKEPRVSIRIADLRFTGMARLVTDPDEELRARSAGDQVRRARAGRRARRVGELRAARRGGHGRR